MRKSKIKGQKEIVGIVQALKKQRKSIVTYNGSFDLLHLGHIKSLEEAKKQGDVLIVLLNSDKSVRSYKGAHRPIVLQNERAQTLAALECVDYITIFNEINPKKILEKIKPTIHCAGADWGKNCIEREVVEKYKGKIHILRWTQGYSTTELIKKTSNAYSRPVIKAVFLDRDGTININQPEYLHKKEDFKFTPFAISALQKLSKSNYKIIITTNQSGIGRGYFKLNDLKKLHQWLLSYLKKKKIRIDRIYYCPHHPKDKCSCRKPKTGMIERAVKDFGINLSKSWIVGDDIKDIILGREVNLKTIFIGKKFKSGLKIRPHYQVRDLKKAIKIILQSN